MTFQLRRTSVIVSSTTPRSDMAIAGSGSPRTQSAPQPGRRRPCLKQQGPRQHREISAPAKRSRGASGVTRGLFNTIGYRTVALLPTKACDQMELDWHVRTGKKAAFRIGRSVARTVGQAKQCLGGDWLFLCVPRRRCAPEPLHSRLIGSPRRCCCPPHAPAPPNLAISQAEHGPQPGLRPTILRSQYYQPACRWRGRGMLRAPDDVA